MVDGSERLDSIGNLPRTCRARLGTWALGNFSLDQRHLGAFDVVRVFLTFLASRAYPVHLVLLEKIVEWQNGHQTGDALQKVSSFEEAVPVCLGSVALGFERAVPLAVSVPPCEQIQQVLRVVPLVDVPLLCLVPSALFFLHLPTEWNSAGRFAVGELYESPE